MSVTLDWKVHIVAAKLNQTDATFSLQHILLRKLIYPLVTTTFTKQQCYQIMLPVLFNGLPKMRVIHTFPWALVHGPLQYGGLETPHLYTEQMAAHAYMILQYGPDREDPTSHLLHMTSEVMRLEMGYCSELLMAPLILAANVTNSWLKHMWTSTQDCQVTLMTDFADCPLQRQGDIELMRLFVQTGWKLLELTTLNQCRMFLQVFLLSDIVVGLGNYILA